MNVADLISLVPDDLRNRSGRVFYSSPEDFVRRGTLYFLGLNPGGDPEIRRDETIEKNLSSAREGRLDGRSLYVDDDARSPRPSRKRFEKRIRHLFGFLRVKPEQVPSSNVIFVRTRDGASLRSEEKNLSERCWRFHEEAMRNVQPRAVVCMGTQAGEIIRKRMGFEGRPTCAFVEDNRREWQSRLWLADGKPMLFALTHPSVADWTARRTDPSSWVRCHMERRLA